MPDRASRPAKRLTILGSTGSIGQSTLNVVRQHRDAFEIEALVANRNIAQLAKDARTFGARIAVTADPSLYADLVDALADSGISAAAGPDAVIEAAQRPVELNIAAIVGAQGLRPTLAALETGITVALANKECLVCAGDVFMRRAAALNVPVIPVDSEHSAIFQCFEGHNADRIDKVTLTASGGPFRSHTADDLKNVTIADALNHPNWSMGSKITIDSATLMNKGLELIEAYQLFPVSQDQIDAIVHPQSIVHSMVSYVDGSVLAQLGVPDMRTPIAWALAYPDRIDAPVERLDLTRTEDLTFEAVRHDVFPAIRLCLGALDRGGSATTVLNAANEIAVAEFLSQRIGFLQIAALVEDTLMRAEQDSMVRPLNSLDDVWEADRYGRTMAAELARNLQI
ncbi:MAG: 1-deoxy-D-xylulose-5-phosphate reductoisomerase [Aestuariivirgaceae bacterium]